MNARTEVDFTFSAALRLPNEAGPKKRVHGHNYRFRVMVSGEPDAAELQRAVRETVLEKVDHRALNDVLPDPTPGNLARWIFAELQPKLAGLVEVALWPTPEHCVRVSASPQW